MKSQNKHAILIVEDEPIVSIYLRDMISSRGYELTKSATSGKEAVIIARKEKPDLILMDIILAGDMDGIETATKIQKESDVPIIYLTANTDENNLKRARESAPHGYLIKPINEYELYSTIEIALTRHSLEKKLKESETFSASLMAHSPNPVIVTNPDFSIRYINLAMEKITGYSLEEITSTEPPYKCNPGSLTFTSETQNGTENSSARSGGLYRNRHGREYIIEVYTAPIIQDGRVLYFLSNWVDVTERRKMEHQLLDISEKERIRIGHDLHDGLGQELTAIGYIYRAIMDKLEKKQFPEPGDTEKLMKLIDNTKTHVRLLSKGLTPVIVERDGLVIAADDLCDNVEKIYGKSCTCTYDEDINISDNTRAAHIFNIIQESINNAIKHGSAEKIEVRLKKHDDDLTITIDDDGLGFDRKKKKKKGLGIELMKYRANIIGGELTIKSNDPRGTIVSLTIRQ